MITSQLDTEWRSGHALHIKGRLAFAFAVGIVAGLASYHLIGRPGYESDLVHFWDASRTVLAGGDPYATPLAGALNPGNLPNLYPFPAYLIFAPFALLPLAAAGGAFMAVSAGLAAFGVAGTGLARAPMFLSAPFLLSLSVGQWSVLLVAGALLPWLSWVAIAKPNVGLATWIARPYWHAAVAMAAIALLSLLVQPDWPWSWLGHLTDREEKFIPVLRPAGFLLLAGLVAVW